MKLRETTGHGVSGTSQEMTTTLVWSVQCREVSRRTKWALHRIGD